MDALVAALVARAGESVAMELQLGIPVQVTSTTPVSGAAPEPVTIATDLTPDLVTLLTGGRPTAATPDPAAQAQALQPETVQVETAQPETAQAETTQDETAQAEPALDAPTGEVTDEPLPSWAHPTGHPARRLRHQGVPEILDHGPVDPGMLAELLTDPDGLPVGLAHITIRRVCIDPTGQAVAIDDRAVPLQRLLAPDKRGRRGRPAPTQTAAGLLERLLTDLPAPPPVTDSYTPTAAQTRLVHARDTTCTFPGCHRRARRAELDHRVPHPEGATSVTNLHPLCKHHHRLKHDGWTCTRGSDGTTTWTSPHGRRTAVPHRS